MQTIVVKLSKIDIEFSEDCKFDRLVIRDGPTITSPALTPPLCGTRTIAGPPTCSGDAQKGGTTKGVSREKVGVLKINGVLVGNDQSAGGTFEAGQTKMGGADESEVGVAYEWTSTGNSVFVEFISDHFVSGNGFEIVYCVVKTTHSEIVRSGNFANQIITETITLLNFTGNAILS